MTKSSGEPSAPSRRELRELDVTSADSSDQTHTPRHGAGERRRRRWPWVVGVIAGMVIILGVTAVVMAKQAFSARDHLQAAKTGLGQITKLYKAGDIAGAKTAYENAQSDANAANDSVNNFLWSAGSAVPWVGQNLSAVRTVTAQTSGILNDAQPLADNLFSLDPDELVKDGALDIDAVRSIVSGLPALNTRLTDASAALGAIDTDTLVGTVSSGVVELKDKVDSVQPTVAQVSDLAQYLPTLLGGEGTQNYLMLFQNNAEVRGLGGNPASLLLLQVENGKVEIADQKSSRDFDNGRATPIAEIPDDMAEVYIPNVTRWEMDMTGIPDLPTVANLAQAWWKDAGGTQQINGVMTFDPVALSYLLNATGPVTLPNGDVLTSDNAVKTLLSDVYAKYPDPDVQDAYFAGAAASVFDALTGDSIDAKKLIEALQKSVGERRFLFWSANADMQAALADNTNLQGVIPADGQTADDTTSVGVYLWDTTGSKIDYHVTNDNTLTRNVCQASGKTTYSIDVTLTSTVTPAEAKKLPAYVLPDGPKAAMKFGTDMYVFGPQGSTFTGMKVIDGGLSEDVVTSGTALERPAVRVATQMAFGTNTTVRLTFEADGTEDSSKLNLLTTPMVHPVGAKTEETTECQ